MLCGGIVETTLITMGLGALAAWYRKRKLHKKNGNETESHVTRPQNNKGTKYNTGVGICQKVQ
jgi:hypothetical protein